MRQPSHHHHTMAGGPDGETEMVSATLDSALAEKRGGLMQKKA
ncbi:MAG TPA: hypothetical protein DEB17_07805 [Chlorobaculum sp.]|uniref:Uncharacterized protein n=1 Tax=Chlorobaculum tepidum (strain ATCC 49652 / DSM 12025 / NBRC 103806 / TLS) TaxID=194439 RepID=Q8KFB9_CHLTE|nr:hypothetical protein CT0408 [Chlorobaculum tepidum TLS]HBU23877.1 hypothetical protein [Chlorobaculum sp.]